LLEQCGFETLEVRTARGDGLNLYQYLLAAVGRYLNDVQRWLRRRPQPSALQPVTVGAAALARPGPA
jgi:hypothetical protein